MVRKREQIWNLQRRVSNNENDRGDEGGRGQKRRRLANDRRDRIKEGERRK